ncbi:MAG: radical SAM family heme chaperone HemW [Gemmatimonadaceae bacterium]
MNASHLYIHVPFCSRRCSYCDFSIAVRKKVPVREYVDALGVELRGLRDEAQLPLTTVYFGGGTPSKLGANGVARMLATVAENFDIATDAEVTLETNPEDVSIDNVVAWKTAGINRLSLGIQTFDDNALAWMHRTHSSAHSSRAIATAREVGITNLSVDLIFALPEDLNRSWSDDLEKILEMKPDHISLYGLTIEKGTPLGRWQTTGKVTPADEDKYSEQFLMAHSAVESAGLIHYEVSNFGRVGKRSRHNSAYWQGVSYVGAGPSAHSFDGKSRRWNVGPYAEWQSRLSSGTSVVEGAELLTEDNRRAEKVYLGLRTIDGYQAGAADVATAGLWRTEGWATVENNVIRLTPEGWLRLDSLAAGLTGL